MRTPLTRRVEQYLGPRLGPHLGPHGGTRWAAALLVAGLLSPASRVGADVPRQPPPSPSPSAPLGPPVGSGATLSILVTGVRSASGQVTALLYLGDGGFPAKEARALRRVSVPASPGSVTLRFTGVAPGSYAVTVYHDENGNGKLDSNWIGIPREPVAVSNNAKGRMGPPKYKDAMFTVGDEDKSLPISLIKI